MPRGHGPHRTGFNDLSGFVFGAWEVIERAANKGTRTAWTCQCACGVVSAVAAVHLIGGKSASCGCSKKKSGRDHPNYRHGGSGSRLYQTWASMIQRCTNPHHKSFDRYGGRGVTICQEWRDSFEAFAVHVGEPPSMDHSIDRIENSRGYEPGNVRWATPTTQSRNRRGRHMVTVGGESMPLSAAVERFGNGLKYSTVHARLKVGRSIDEALRNE